MTSENPHRETPLRFRPARSDASVGEISATIEEQFGLPEGSVRLVRPNGGKKRSDASIGSLREDWNE